MCTDRRLEEVVSRKTALSIFILILTNYMASFDNIINSKYHIDRSVVQSVQGRLNEEMKVDGWVSLILSNKECLVLEFNNGVFMNQ